MVLLPGRYAAECLLLLTSGSYSLSISRLELVMQAFCCPMPADSTLAPPFLGATAGP